MIRGSIEVVPPAAEKLTLKVIKGGITAKNMDDGSGKYA